VGRLRGDLCALRRVRENLIEAINILGSIFYGVAARPLPGGVLSPPVAAAPWFIAAVTAQALVIVM